VELDTSDFEDGGRRGVANGKDGGHAVVADTSDYRDMNEKTGV
jgi:hypothetical protein